MDWIVTLQGQDCIYHLHMIIVRGRRGLIMSVSFRREEGLERGCPFVRGMFTWAGRPSAEHIYPLSSAEDLWSLRQWPPIPALFNAQ